MTTAHHALAPPDYDENKTTWREYKKEIDVWSSLTSLPKEKHGPALWMALKGKAKDAVKEMEIKDIKVDNGLEVMIEKLDALFKTDENQAAYLAYRDFENLLRPPEMSFQEFVIKFEASNGEIKRYQMVLPDGVLAYRFLHSANLKDEEIKLCRATISSFTYDEMKRKVLSLYGDKVQASSEGLHIKKEEVFYNQQSNRPQNRWNDQHRPAYDSRGGGEQYRTPYDSRGGNDQHRSAYDSDLSKSYDKSNRNWNRGGGGNRRGGSDQTRRGGRDHFAIQKKRNPNGANGKPKQCGICSSTYHFARDCPESQEESASNSNNIGFVQQEESAPTNLDEVITLFQDTVDNNDSLKWFLGETIGCAVVDSGCSKTVAGSKWVQCFLESLDSDDLSKIHTKASNEVFKFGKGESIRSKGKIIIPVQFGTRKATIESDIVEADVPLLLSKEALKKAETVLDFNNDTALMFGEKQTLIATESGHYAIPLSITQERDAEEEQITLIVSASEKVDNDDLIVPYKLAAKLHRQFCHCSANKLIKLIKDSKRWPEDETSDIIREVRNITDSCNICKQYKKSPPTPIVCISLSSYFNEAVAMDLFEIQGKNVLHLIDMFSRYSAACVRSSKKQDEIADGIMKVWISYFGKPIKFLADNGGEFANETYTDMCAAFGIEKLKTSAESPWSNGLAERHNGVLKVSTMKTMEETGCTVHTGVAWAVSAKNTLDNNFGYSSNMIVFGRNPGFPSVLSDNIAALTAENLSEIVEENMKTMHAARKAFIEAESSEKIKRALSHNIRTSCEENYGNGEKVFFKRDDSRRWYGPATVIGQDGKQVMVKNGGQVIRVHKARLNRVGEELLLDQSHENNATGIDTNSNQINDENHNQHTEELIHCEIIEAENANKEDKEQQNNIDQISDNSEDQNPNQNNETNEINATKQIENPKQSNKLVHPKVKTHILYKVGNDENWMRGFVYSRAGKINGKYESHFNIQNDDNKIIPYDFNNVQWEPVPSEVLITTRDNDAIMTAKHKEIENWKKNDVFEEVPFDNQNTITTRWVITTKEKDSIMITKARLVARGFEDQGTDKGKVDSPTCSKESLALILSILSMKKWQCQAIDIKTAFLQGKRLDRDVYLKPPKEFQSQGIVWKLKKAVYGLNEASRAWYDRVKTEFEKLGLTKSKFDEALFYKKSCEKLIGSIAIHVDDFIYGGNQQFMEIITKIKNIFEVGTESASPMKFIGMNIEQNDDQTTSIHQKDYIRDLKFEQTKLPGDKYRNLTAEEQRVFRGIVGQLNWIASRTDPTIAYDVCILSTKLQQATVIDYQYAVKVVKKAMEGKTLHYSPLKSPSYLLAYSDASYANLPDGGSQGGYIVFLADKTGQLSPITWASRKLRRVCRSTITAETMATLDTIDVCAWLSSMFREVLDVEVLKTVVRTDNKSAYDAINSTTAVEEKRLRVDIAAIRECVGNNEVEVQWVSKENQLADVLTKQGADSTKLLKVLSQKHL